VTVDVVTGAFGFSGRKIASRLIERGRTVRTLTNHAHRGGEQTEIEVCPLDFDDPAGLAESLRGATTLYNTYWVRFPHGSSNHERAVENSRTMFFAARQAGVERIVHVSITHATNTSPYSYFRNKALVERALAETGIPYAILRPAILFGDDGVLINNIAWLLRRLPVFAIGGRGDYRIRPIHVDDLADLAVSMGDGRADEIIDAVGPERPTFREMVGAIRTAVDSRARLVRVPGPVIPLAAGILDLALRDVLLTKEEYLAMAGGLADTDGPPSGKMSLSGWLAENGHVLGLRYAHEIERHYRP
jgi:NADH dehydrogenase